MAAVHKAIEYTPIYSRETDLYALPELAARTVDAAYLRELGVETVPAPETLAGLSRGSEIFRQRMREHLLLPRPRYTVEEIDPAAVEPEIHNYTGHCPTLTWEINPVKGCGVGCQYCLVNSMQIFTENCIRKGYKKILFIHGKGNHSQDPVLGNLVRLFIEHNPKLGKSAHPDAKLGGSGATWVMIKR